MEQSSDTLSRTYISLNYPNSMPEDDTQLTNINKIDNSKEVYISGLHIKSQAYSIGFIYKGCLLGKGIFYSLNYPGSTSTSISSVISYRDGIRAVGQCTIHDKSFGFMYQGLLPGLGEWTSINPACSIHTICNSIAHNVIIGIYNTELQPNLSFVYDINTKNYYTLNAPNLTSIQANDLCYNGNDLYTICGGLFNTTNNIRMGYIVDFHATSCVLFNWRTYMYNIGETYSTDFTGISLSTHYKEYSITGTYFNSNTTFGLFARIRRNLINDTFEPDVKWETIIHPESCDVFGISVYTDIVIGTYIKQLASKSSNNGFIAQRS